MSKLFLLLCLFLTFNHQSMANAFDKIQNSSILMYSEVDPSNEIFFVEDELSDEDIELILNEDNNYYLVDFSDDSVSEEVEQLDLHQDVLDAINNVLQAIKNEQPVTTENDDNKILIEDESERSQSVTDQKIEELAEDLEITPSSSGLKWKESYTKVLLKVFEHEKIRPLFETKINDKDLKKIGCTNLNSLNIEEKKQFFVVYMAAIAEAESDYRTHITTINKGDWTTNVGMLQIDVDAARNHTKKILGDVSKGRLKDPHFNLKVGAFVLKNQIAGKIANGRLFPRRSYYWQVLTYPKRFLNTIEKNRENIPFCIKN